MRYVNPPAVGVQSKSTHSDFSGLDGTETTNTTTLPYQLSFTPDKPKTTPTHTIILRKNEDIVPIGYNGPYVLGLTFNTGLIRYTEKQPLSFATNVLQPHERLHYHHLQTKGYFSAREEFNTRFQLDQLYLR